MSRQNLSHTGQKRLRARRDHALARLDLREESSPRKPAAGATSACVKVIDPELERMIAAALERRSKEGKSQ